MTRTPVSTHHQARPPRPPLAVEQLEARDTPTVGAGGYAVGTDADPTLQNHSTVATYGISGPLLAAIPGMGTAFAPFGEFFGGVRAVMSNFATTLSAGSYDVAAATGPSDAGNPSRNSEVKVYSSHTGAVVFDQYPFGAFTGGLFVAAMDVNNDGYADLVVTPDEGGGPRVKIYDGNSIANGQVKVLADFFGIDDPNFRGGCRPAAGLMRGTNNSPTPAEDLVIAAGYGGGPRVSIYRGDVLGYDVVNGVPFSPTDGASHLVPDFFVFEQSLRNGVYVAVGGTDDRGYGWLIAGGGPGGAPRVLILDSLKLQTQGVVAALASPVDDFFAGPSTSRGGIRVASKGGYVITGSGSGDGSRVTGHLDSVLALQNTTSVAYDGSAFPGFSYGVFVG